MEPLDLPTRQGNPVRRSRKGLVVATRPFVQPDCVALESALADRCCVLVGEAGIGKSDAIDQLEAITKVAVRKAAAHGVALRDLRKLTGFVDLGLGTVALTGG